MLKVFLFLWNALYKAENPNPVDNVGINARSINSECNQETAVPSSADPSPLSKDLPRRELKNRRREDEGRKRPLPHQRRFKPTTSRIFDNLGISEGEVASKLWPYCLSINQMMSLGYPVETTWCPGRAIILKEEFKVNITQSKLNANAKEFVPGINCAGVKADHASGQGCGDLGEVVEQQCVRCRKDFLLTEDFQYVNRERCWYHWGKLQRIIAPAAKDMYEFVWQYSCCGGNPDTPGCSTCQLHVWNGVKAGLNGPYDNYVDIRRRRTPPRGGSYGVYALDCEMCYTAAGMELTKIAVVGTDGRLVYDTFVRPEREIIDYNTRFSGITAEDLSRKCGVKTLREVQKDLMCFINANTILIGHGLENDLRALRMLHYTVVDTAVVFPHERGLPYRRSLKAITSAYLKREIQCGQNGHCSYEDALACMDLMLWKVLRG